LHRENIIVDASVVSLLVFEVVETLSEFCYELVLVGASDFDAGGGALEKVRSDL